MTNISLFWSGKLLEGETFRDWTNKTIKLSYFHEATLHSHTVFKNRVNLYTYHDIDKNHIKIPDEINIIDAHNYFPVQDAYDALERGHSIAHISDLVRLKASLETDAVVMDIDNIVVNTFPNDDVFTSTMPAKTTGGMAIKFGPEKNHKPFNIRDNSWNGHALSVFPLKVHSSIRTDVERIIEQIRSVLSAPPSTSKSAKTWNFVMWELKEIANKYDFVRVMKPIEFGAIPAWKSAGKCYSLDSPSKFDGETELFGYTMPSKDQIFKESFAIQHFFESAFKKADPIGKNFWSDIKKGSLLDDELRLIYGDQWRYDKIENYAETGLEIW